MKTLFEIAEDLLCRPLTERDGLAEEDIIAAQNRLGLELPKVLKNFYLHLGGNQLFMEAFLHLFSPENLTVADEMLIFIAENQEVILWGLKVDALSSDDPGVFQVNPENISEISSEEKSLSEFLRITLYYQAAQGGYKFCGWVYDYQEVLPRIEKGWEKVVEVNGLHIWWQAGKIIFKLDGPEFDFITAAAQAREMLEEMVDAFGFEQTDLLNNGACPQ